jgi:hypothetical protein
LRPPWCFWVGRSLSSSPLSSFGVPCVLEELVFPSLRLLLDPYGMEASYLGVPKDSCSSFVMQEVFSSPCLFRSLWKSDVLLLSLLGLWSVSWRFRCLPSPLWVRYWDSSVTYGLPLSSDGLLPCS